MRQHYVGCCIFPSSHIIFIIVLVLFSLLSPSLLPFLQPLSFCTHRNYCVGIKKRLKFILNSVSLSLIVPLSVSRHIDTKTRMIHSIDTYSNVYFVIFQRFNGLTGTCNEPRSLERRAEWKRKVRWNWTATIHIPHIFDRDQTKFFNNLILKKFKSFDHGSCI